MGVRTFISVCSVSSCVLLAGCGSSGSSSVGASGSSGTSPAATLSAAIAKTASAGAAQLSFKILFTIAGVPGTPNTTVVQTGNGEIDPGHNAAEINFTPSSSTGNLPLSLIYVGGSTYVDAAALGGPSGHWVLITPKTKFPSSSAGPFQIAPNQLSSVSPVELLSVGKGLTRLQDHPGTKLVTSSGTISTDLFSGLVNPSGNKSLSSLVAGVASLGGGSSAAASTTGLLGISSSVSVWVYQSKIAKEKIVLDFSKFFKQLLSAFGGGSKTNGVKVLASVSMNVGPYQTSTAITQPSGSELVTLPSGNG